MALFFHSPVPSTPPRGPRTEQPFIFNDLPLFPLRLLTSFDSPPHDPGPNPNSAIESGTHSAISDSNDHGFFTSSPARTLTRSIAGSPNSAFAITSPFQDAAMRSLTPAQDENVDETNRKSPPIALRPLRPSSPVSPEAIPVSGPSEPLQPFDGRGAPLSPPQRELTPERPLVPTNAADWEAKKDIIQELYMNKNLILNDVVNIMLRTHNFKATCVCPQRHIRRSARD